MPLDIRAEDILKHLKVDRVPLETLLAAIEVRGGNNLDKLFHTLQSLVEQGKIRVDIRLARPFKCPSCKKNFATERAREQHLAAKHPDIPKMREHLASLGIPLDGKTRRLPDPKMAGASYVVVTEKPVLDRCPQCGQATLQQIPVPGFFNAPRIRYRCTNPECGYKDEDTC